MLGRALRLRRLKSSQGTAPTVYGLTRKLSVYFMVFITDNNPYGSFSGRFGELHNGPGMVFPD